MRNLVCIFALLLFPVALLSSLETVSAQALPMQFAKWTASSPTSRIGRAAVQQLADIDGAVLREDGLLDAERRSYEHDGRSMKATLYRMHDSSGAYAAFTALRSADMAQTDLAPFSGINADRALFVIGSQLMEVSAVDGASLADLRALVASVGSRIEKSPYPSLGNFLPVRGRVPNSEKYILGTVGFRSAIGSSAPNSLRSGDWVEFESGAEAAIGRYRSSGGETVLLLVEYPTPQVAAEKLKQIEKLQFREDLREPVPFIARRKGSLLSMVLAPKSDESANALLDQVRYQTEVTWNEPTHQFKEPSLSVMIVEAFVGTGVILMFALIAGLGFGGLRLLTKHLLPGKVFDRQEHVEILQLGISSKPIEGRDFY